MNLQNPPSKVTKQNWLKWLIVLLLTVILTVGSYVLGEHSAKQAKYLNTTNTQNLPNQHPAYKVRLDNKWEKLVSNQKGYPVIKDAPGEFTNTFSIYSFSSRQIRPTNILTVGIGGASDGSGHGGTYPLASPNLLYTVYIDKDTSNLWLLSNDSLKTEKITNNGNVGHIAGWSPNSKKSFTMLQKKQ